MVSNVTNINALQMLRGIQAFKEVQRNFSNIEKPEKENDIGADVLLTLQNQDLSTVSKPEKTNESTVFNKHISEIKEAAGKYGINNVSDEDINYAIRYGRSVLIDVAG